MKKILIIGNTGSGKTTFSKQLAKVTGLPLVHLDKLYWHGDWEHRSSDDFDALLQNELEKPRWVIDGNFNRTIPHRLKYCDTVFFFDIPTVVCLWGLTKRVFQSYGKTRDDMGGNCPERFDCRKWELYKNAIGFRRKNREKYLNMLSSTENVEVIIFKSRIQSKRFLKKLSSE